MDLVKCFVTTVSVAGGPSARAGEGMKTATTESADTSHVDTGGVRTRTSSL